MNEKLEKQFDKANHDAKKMDAAVLWEENQRLKEALRQAEWSLEYYADNAPYTSFVTMHGEHAPGILKEKGERAKQTLSEIRQQLNPHPTGENYKREITHTPFCDIPIMSNPGLDLATPCTRIRLLALRDTAIGVFKFFLGIGAFVLYASFLWWLVPREPAHLYPVVLFLVTLMLLVIFALYEDNLIDRRHEHKD